MALRLPPPFGEHYGRPSKNSQLFELKTSRLTDAGSLTSRH